MRPVVLAAALVLAGCGPSVGDYYQDKATGLRYEVAETGPCADLFERALTAGPGVPASGSTSSGGRCAYLDPTEEPPRGYPRPFVVPAGEVSDRFDRL